MSEAAREVKGELVEREIDAGAVGVIVGAEVDKQIATARKFPRSIQRFKEEAISLVSLTPETAEACVYSLERDGKVITGPSARLAEILAYSWSNFRSGARIVGQDEEFVTAQGFAWDLEKNSAIGYEVRRRIVNSRGNRYSLDMIGVTSNAAASIALRNAILKVIPKAIWSEVYDKAVETIRGDFTTFTERREKAIQALVSKYGVTPSQIFEKLGVAGEADVQIDDIVTLRGFLTALKEGDTTVEELFPKPKTAAERGAGAAMRSAMNADRNEAVRIAVEALKTKASAEEITKFAEGLPDGVKTADDFTKAVAARLAEIGKKKEIGTPKLKKTFLDRFAKADADTLSVVLDETRGYDWTAEERKELDAAWDARRVALGINKT